MSTINDRWPEYGPEIAKAILATNLHAAAIVRLDVDAFLRELGRPRAIPNPFANAIDPGPFAHRDAECPRCHDPQSQCGCEPGARNDNDEEGCPL